MDTALGEFLLTVWLPAMESSLSEATAHNYRAVIGRNVVPHIGRLTVQSLTPAHLNKLYSTLLEKGGRNGNALSPRTVKLTHTILRKAMHDAVRWNVIARNPADAADPPKAQRKKPVVWTASEAKVFLEFIQADRMRALWVLAATTGMRRAELAGLRWCDVDLDAGSISVVETRTSVGYKVVTKAPKTTSGSRTIAIAGDTVTALREHRTRQVAERLHAGSAYDSSNDLIFVHEDGAAIHPELLSEWFKRRVTAAGVPLTRFHDLRHLHATLMLQSREHPQIVSRRLGHSSVAFTLDTYSHVTPQMDQEAAERMASILR